MDREISTSYSILTQCTIFLIKQEQKYFSFELGILLMNVSLEKGKVTGNRDGYRYTYSHTTQKLWFTQRYKHGF